MTAAEWGVLLLCCALPGEEKPLSLPQFQELGRRARALGCQGDDPLRELTARDLARLGYDAAQSARITRLLAREAQLEQYLRAAAAQGITAVTRLSSQYPARLRHTLGPRCPAVLFAKGEAELLSARCISVVGSRELSGEGRAFAAEAGRRIAAEGFALCSGGAAGADRAAQDACLAHGGSAVIFTDDENPKLTYTSEKGNITVPAGSYTVTVSDTEEYTFSEGVFTAVTDLNDFNLTDIAPAQSGGKILLGFKDENDGYLNRTANLKINAGERLYAVYTDFPVSGENAVFSVSGFERRGGEKLGIRFILEKRNGFEAATAPLSGMKYGFAAMPEHFLNIGEALTVDNENAAVRTVGGPGFVFFDGREKFTACITDIPEKHYAEGFAVRGFVTYTDLNGNSRTVYTEVSCASLMEATADSALNGGLTDSEKAETARLADNSLSLKRASLESSVSNCPDIIRNSVSGNIYYVSESGSDSNDGLSELKPLKTLYGVSSLSLNAGDAVLFERGGVYRTSKKYTDGSSFILKSGVSYGAYGKGQKPVINGSFENYAERKWRKYADNIWYISISNISADPGVLRVTTTKNYSYTGCVKESIDALAREWDFCRDGTNLYMYCQYGEPTNLLNAIEIGFGFDMFKIDNASNITIENLTFTCGGRHAVGASNGAASVTVRGCEFSYIGGSLMSGSDGTRLGNAVEFLGSSSDILVEKCKFSDIYDSGVTFQGLSAKVNGFTARSNVFDKCGLASFEYWLGTAGYAENITVEDNYMSNAGGGFGGIGKRSINAKYVAHIRADGANRISNFIIRSNVLDSAADGACLAALCCYKSSGGSLPTLFRNVYIRKSGEWLLSVTTESAADAAVFSADTTGIDYLKQSFDNKPIVILR